MKEQFIIDGVRVMLSTNSLIPEGTIREYLEKTTTSSYISVTRLDDGSRFTLRADYLLQYAKFQDPRIIVYRKKH